MDGLPDGSAAPLIAARSITGLLLALLTLLVAGWIFREVTGQRDGRSVAGMLARPLRATWRASVALWFWWLWSSVAFWSAVREICFPLADSPAHPPRRS